MFYQFLLVKIIVTKVFFLQVWLTTLVLSFSTQAHGVSMTLEFWQLVTQWTASWSSLQTLEATILLESVLQIAPER